MGGLAEGLPAGTAVQVVELARQLCSQRSAGSEVDRSLGRRRGRVPQEARRLNARESSTAGCIADQDDGCFYLPRRNIPVSAQQPGLLVLGHQYEAVPPIKVDGPA